MENNKCIYYLNQPNLSFETEEHIFPAGLGGIMKLPKGYVSAEFNNAISSVELRFMRESIIALPRQIMGPGKRGKMAIKYATKTTLHLIEDVENAGSYSIGYMQLGKPYEIPQIKYNQLTNYLECSMPKGNNDEIASDILLHLRKFRNENVRYIKDDRLDINNVMIGFDKHVYIFKSTQGSFEIDSNFINILIHAIQNITKTPTRRQFKIKTSQNATLGEDYYRICAKTALNALAMILGKELVIENQFDGIRDYITNGGEVNYVKFGSAIAKTIQFPESSHHIVLSSGGRNLYANVCFYNHFEAQVLLSSDFKGHISADGFVCDWKHRKEYRLGEYLTHLVTSAI